MQKIKIYKTKPPRDSGWEAYDAARTAEQARELVESYPGNAIIVKTGKQGDVFPYTIFVKDTSQFENRMKFRHQFGF